MLRLAFEFKHLKSYYIYRWDIRNRFGNPTLCKTTKSYIFEVKVLKCFICSKEISEGRFCDEHSKQLYTMLKDDSNIVQSPDGRHHCHICGRFEDREIVEHPFGYFCDKDIIPEYRRYLEKKGPLYRLIDTELSSVEFVRDYIQFRFDGPCLATYLLPEISIGPRVILWNEQGYRDSLCEQIGQRVYSIRCDNTLEIEFENKVILTLDLNPQDFEGAEVGMFTDDNLMVVFQC